MARQISISDSFVGINKTGNFCGRFPLETIKSPLRYPGGKSRAVSTLRSYIPRETKVLVSPFLGGGSLELSCAADGIKVYAADAFDLLINFWDHAKANPIELSERVSKYFPLERSKFYSLQKNIYEIDCSIERAAIFFVLNRSSFSGITLSGGMSPNHPRFTRSAIDRLKNFRASNIFFECADFEVTIEKHPNELLYLDPPYANGEKLYGTKGDMHISFDHEKLANILKKRSGWILSYNDHSTVRELYKGYDFKTPPDWTYGMSSNKASNELLIVNV